MNCPYDDAALKVKETIVHAQHPAGSRLKAEERPGPDEFEKEGGSILLTVTRMYDCPNCKGSYAAVESLRMLP